MYIGTSIFLIAVGAILKWAVTGSVSGVDVHTAGLILLIVGILGLIISLFMANAWRDRDREVAARDPRYRDPV
jgi:hypothetical protein